jgi:hypothetical protein
MIKDKIVTEYEVEKRRWLNNSDIPPELRDEVRSSYIGAQPLMKAATPGHRV